MDSHHQDDQEHLEEQEDLEEDVSYTKYLLFKIIKKSNIITYKLQIHILLT